MNKHTLYIVLATLASTHQLAARSQSIYTIRAKTADSTSIALNEVLITENRLQIPFSRLNRNVQLMDRQLIDALPARSLNELLGYANGVDIRQRGPFGTQADLSIDGGTFEQTLVLVNGVKILDSQTGHNSLNLPIPTDAIERIEVIRGPAARIYGTNSLTGAINIVTKKPEDGKLTVHAYGGSSFRTDTAGKGNLFHGRGAQIGWHAVRSRHRHSVHGGHDSGNGYRYNTAFKNSRLYYQGDVDLNDDNGLAVMAGYVSSDFGANGFYAAPGDVESQEIVQTVLASLGLRSQLAERIVLSPRVSYRYGYDDYRYYRHDLSRARSRHYTHTLNAELNGTVHTPVGDVGLGLESRHERIASSNIGRHARNNYGLYTEFRTERLRNAWLNVGAYFNYNSDYGWQVFPGIDVGYRLDEAWRLVAHAGTGQRIPSFTDLYLDQRPGNLGNPLLSSENSWQAEVGIRHDGSRWQLDAGYFLRRISDFIDWVRQSSEQPWQPMNFAGTQTHGAVFSYRYRLSSSVRPTQWNVALGYSFLSPSFERTDDTRYQSKYAIESLRHQLIGRVHMSHQRLSAMAAVRVHERISYKRYAVADMRIAYDAQPIRVYLDMQNMGDVTYIEAGAVPMPGRWFSVGVHYDVY